MTRRQPTAAAPSRRSFLCSGAAAGLFGLARGGPALSRPSPDVNEPDRAVHFLHDGLILSPPEYARLLEQIASAGKAGPDTYLSGGAVRQLEEAFARALGKEKVVFVPTGTLANHLAVRALARDASRVVVPAESHIYNDSSDCVEVLSHLNLVPVGAGKATFTVAEVDEAVRRATNGPYPVRVGAVVVECPVRRADGVAFDFAEMKRVSEYARKHGMGLHLDGARLYVASAYTGVAPADYAALFDTVYVSLYKYFNAGGGAVLAGPAAVVDAVAHARKLFGGGVYQAWPQAAVALHFFTGFPERYARAVAAAKTLFAALAKDSRLRVEGYPCGTNVIKLHVTDVDPKKYQEALRARGILLRPAGRDSHELRLAVNESLNRRPAEELARDFIESLAAR
jgi:threonine aldolase